MEDKSGRFWFGTRGGTCIYDGKDFTEFTKQDGGPYTNVRSIIEDKDGYLWFGGNDGLWRYDGSLLANIATGFAGDIYEDKAGNIWTSSADDGNARNWVLSRYDKNTLHSESPTVVQVVAQENMFFGIVEDTNGSIWLGTLHGAYRCDGETVFDFTRGP